MKQDGNGSREALERILSELKESKRLSRVDQLLAMLWRAGFKIVPR